MINGQVSEMKVLLLEMFGREAIWEADINLHEIKTMDDAQDVLKTLTIQFMDNMNEMALACIYTMIAYCDDIDNGQDLYEHSDPYGDIISSKRYLNENRAGLQQLSQIIVELYSSPDDAENSKVIRAFDKIKESWDNVEVSISLLEAMLAGEDIIDFSTFTS